MNLGSSIHDVYYYCKGPSIKYASIFEGGGVYKMLTLADIGEGGIMNT